MTASKNPGREARNLVGMSRGSERLEALDLAIKALKDHEKRLNSFVERLKAIVDRLERLKATEHGLLVTWCNQWGDFLERSKGASLVTFEWIEKKGLAIRAISNGKIYKYAFTVKNFKMFLSQQLGVPEERVIEGEIIVPDNAHLSSPEVRQIGQPPTDVENTRKTGWKGYA